MFCAIPSSSHLGSSRLAAYGKSLSLSLLLWAFAVTMEKSRQTTADSSTGSTPKENTFRVDDE
eukprot:1942386-Pyramimonas_sp.AAC.1